MLGLGIWVYFVIPIEPDVITISGAAAISLVAVLMMRAAGAILGVAVIVVALVSGGFALAALRAQGVAAPVLEGRYYGPVQGRVVEIDRSSRDLPRITLDQVVLEGLSSEETPERVRVSVYGDQPWLPQEPGTIVILTAHLAPPTGPAEPGDFDFRRLAWYAGLGAVGYVRTPVLTLAPPQEGWALRTARLRAGLSDAVMARIPGDAGGLAAAMMTGDRSGLSEQANDEMRAANLYHLVSISGTHMAMLVAFVFGLIRYGVALMPSVALRLSAKKIAAAIALPVAASYLVLAGRDMATERAFVMVAVMLIAVLLDRQAITVRSVAIAALIVLVFRPEALVNPGFQMSFAASLALVVVFSKVSDIPVNKFSGGWLRPIWLVLLSSFVAGMATAPFAAAHFNRIAHYGLGANLLATPAMALLVMPGAVAMALLGPLGVDRPAIWMVESGCQFILRVASEVARIPGAESAVPHPPDAVIPLIATGGLWICLWQGRCRWAGLAGPMLAVAVWLLAARPVVLIAAGGGLVGVMGPEGRALNSSTNGDYVAETWIANDGELATQEDVAARPGWSGEGRVWWAEAAGVSILWVGGEKALANIAGCGGADILVTSADAGDSRPCVVLDAAMLARTGAVTIDHTGHMRTVAETAGRRLWTVPVTAN